VTIPWFFSCFFYDTAGLYVRAKHANLLRFNNIIKRDIRRSRNITSICARPIRS
jgi:hypothetical protein